MSMSDKRRSSPRRGTPKLTLHHGSARGSTKQHSSGFSQGIRTGSELVNTPNRANTPNTIDRQAIIDCLSRLVTPGIKLTALADELGIRKHDYAALRAKVLELVEEGVAHIRPGGAFALAPMGRTADALARPTAAATKQPKRDKAAFRHDGSKPRQKDHRRTRTALPARPASAAPQPAEPDTTEFIAESVDESIAAVDGAHVGRITVHPAGYGFVALDEGDTVFIPARHRGHSLDGDRVAVETWAGIRGTEGRVIRILTRGRARLTGIARRVGRAVYLEPDDPRIAADYGRVHLDDGPSGLGKDGDAVVAEITRYPDPIRRELAAKVIKVLGDPEDPRTEIEKILAVSMIPIDFPDDAFAQAAATPQELTPADLADRIDLRDRRFCTIDPETARDFDDALCIETGPHGGPRVWIAVADVSHYVRWNDALDREAALRGVSVYLPDRVIPMLPMQLSANICSLNPLVDRCAMVVRLDYGDDLEVIDANFAAAVIRSKARLDYPGVAAALEGDFRGRRESYRPWRNELQQLNALARVLRARRHARGALDLEIAEPKVVLDADDPRLVRDVVKAKGEPAVAAAYQLVEEFMIAANEAVGSFFRKRGAATVWRVHAPPDPDRVAQLAELLGSYGIVVDVDSATTPRGMKHVLDQIALKPGAQALSFLVLRTLTQAVWDTVGMGHFGLASGDYLHFTSPIRRYPDLIVHRLLKHQLHVDGHASGGGYGKTPPAIETLTELAGISSGHERRAMEAEREAVAMYRAYLMRDQVGEQFTGVVSAVTSFGAFVELDAPFVEGLIKLDSLGERFQYDEVHMRLVAERSGRAIELGDRVTIEIANVSVARRRIDFAWVAAAATEAPEKSTPSKRSRPARRGSPEPVLVPNPRASVRQRKKAGQELDRAQLGRVERGAKRRVSGNGKLRIGVSHRSPTKAGVGKKR